MLTASDPITWRPRRIAVAGITGAGKTTVARRIAAELHSPHTEIDALYHGQGWQPRPSFEADVAAVVRADEWVVEWQYDAVRPVIARRADTLVWLDLPFPIVLGRLLRRTVRRSIRRELLWNDNREPPLRTFFTDREHIVRWAFRTRRKYRDSVPSLERELPALRVVRLRSPSDVETWLTSLSRSGHDRP